MRKIFNNSLYKTPQLATVEHMCNLKRAIIAKNNVLHQARFSSDESSFSYSRFI